MTSEIYSTIDKNNRRRSNCVIQGCKSGHGGKISLFSVPKGKLNEWKKLIPPTKKLFDEKSVICSLHFEPCFVETHYKTVIRGKDILLPRGKPLLKKNAIPSIFPNLPKDFTSQLHEKRTQLQCSEEENEPKIIKLCVFESADEAKAAELCHYKPKISLNELCDVSFPDDYWVKVKYKNMPNIITFMVCDSYLQKRFHSDKEVVIEEIEGGEFTCRGYIKGCLVTSGKICTKEELSNVLKSLDDANICNGAGSLFEFQQIRKYIEEKNKDKIEITEDHLRSAACSGKVETKNSTCVRCKALRKLLITVRLRKRNEPKQNEKKNKRKIELITAKRLKNQVIVLKNKIENLNLRHENEIRHAIDEKVKMFSPLQQLHMKECMKASQRNDTKGMIYDKQWLTECLIMYKKSPKLYEHMRLSNILVLPSHSTLQREIRDYRAGFGFNENISSSLNLKTEQKDDFEKHGIMFDEMSLAENLHLDSHEVT